MASIAETLEQLTLQIPHILAAPKDSGVISTLCIRPKEGERLFTDEMALSVADGVVGDRWKHHTWIHLDDGSPDPRIQVCILQKRVLDLVRPDPETMAYPGDNIIVDMDLSESNLPVGTRLKAGSAVLEVSDVFNTACPKWHARYGAAALRWVNVREHVPLRLRGILCQIVNDGTLRISDRLEVIERPGKEDARRSSAPLLRSSDKRK